MTRILIIEDEIPAIKKLKGYLRELDTQTEVAAQIQTVDYGISFLKSSSVDLIFSDIELLDGNAFEIYREVDITCPIIFTTTYDQFWLEAFETNGIDYLLKPFSKERFAKAWKKFEMLRKKSDDYERLLATITALAQRNMILPGTKKRFLISSSKGAYFIETSNIFYFEASGGVVFAHDSQHNKHLLAEATLKEVEQKVDSLDFFRLNRSQLVSKAYIEKIFRHNKNSLTVKLKGSDRYLYTSQVNTASFRIWLEK